MPSTGTSDDAERHANGGQQVRGSYAARQPSLKSWLDVIVCVRLRFCRVVTRTVDPRGEQLVERVRRPLFHLK